MPFAIVPNGNSITNSAELTSNQVVIGDLNTYLSSAYRTGVDPARPSTVSTLYPLSVSTINTISGNNAQNLYDFGCSGSSSNVITGSGTVQSIQPGSIRVNTDNGPVSLFVSGCTNM